MAPTTALLTRQTNSDSILSNALTASDWLTAALILISALVLAMIVSRLLRKVIAHGIGPGFASMVVARLVSYSIFVIGVFYALTTLGVRLGPLLGALGLGGLVLALALQGVVENFVSSIILQARRPFTIGDLVELDGRLGIVADVDSRTTQLRSLDGTRVSIPNASVVSSTIVNLTREPIRRSSLEVGVSYDTDLQHALATIRAAVGRASRVLGDPPAWINASGFGDSSIQFTIFYWHASDVPSELAARSDLIVAVHQALASENITIAFPQVVVWTGTEVDAGPYGHPPREVRTPFPELEKPSGQRKIRRPQRRPSTRRRERNGDGE